MSGSYIPNREDQQAMVKKAMEQFPAEFGLRHSPGKVFMINESASFYSEYDSAVLLYTFIKNIDEKTGEVKWLSYAKGTVYELKQNICRLPQ
jgi:hypothetical protein